MPTEIVFWPNFADGLQELHKINYVVTHMLYYVTHAK